MCVHKLAFVTGHCRDLLGSGLFITGLLVLADDFPNRQNQQLLVMLILLRARKGEYGYPICRRVNRKATHVSISELKKNLGKSSSLAPQITATAKRSIKAWTEERSREDQRHKRCLTFYVPICFSIQQFPD